MLDVFFFHVEDMKDSIIKMIISWIYGKGMSESRREY
jgi:hypothetical protein